MKNRVALLAWIGSRIGKPRGWERVVRWFASPERCASIAPSWVERDHFAFFAQPATPLGWNVLLFGTYEPELREIFRSALPEGGVAVDVGANVGWHSLLMARLAGPDGRVFAIEPNPSVRERLNANLAANRVGNVSVLPFALSESEGPARFHGPPDSLGASGSGHLVSVNLPESTEVLEVETRRLDAVLAAAGVERLDLMKIDVEGFEWPVLRGAEESIARFRPQVVFEFNTEYLSRGAASPELFEDFFRRHRYRLCAVGRTGARTVAPGEWPSCADIWAVPLV